MEPFWSNEDIPYKVKSKPEKLIYLFGGYRRNFSKNTKKVCLFILISILFFKTKLNFYILFFKSHQSVTKKMYDKFRKYNNKWLKANAISADCIDDWLMGENYSNVNKTVRVKENYPKKPPYHIYYKYKIDNSSSTGSNSNTTTKRNNVKTDWNKKNQNTNNNNSNEDSPQIPSITHNESENLTSIETNSKTDDKK